jgi:hypothetical protein
MPWILVIPSSELVLKLRKADLAIEIVIVKLGCGITERKSEYK